VGRVKLTGRALVLAGAAVLVVAAGGTALAVGIPSTPPSSPASSLPAAGHSSAALEVTSGTAVLSVSMANLGGTSGTLLQVATPRGGPRPQLRVAGADGTARSGNEFIVLSASSGSGAVRVTLNAAVSWLLDFAGGTDRTTADLRGGRVVGITIGAGSSVVDLTLPQPDALVPVVLAGGASEFTVSLPSGVPVRVTAAGGAGQVTLDGRTYTGVGGGSVFASPGWSAGAPGYDIDASSGAAQVSVTRWGGS
jgi:hypothetical protein